MPSGGRYVIPSALEAEVEAADPWHFSDEIAGIGYGDPAT
jgi:hypothetical protein